MITSLIRDDAYKILQLLDEIQISSVFDIEKQLSMQKQDVLITIGWLALENRIYFIGDKNDCKIMILEDVNDD